MEHPIDRAARILGSQVTLASLLKVTKAAVGQWRHEGRRVPAEHCPVIERETRMRGETVPCEDLRPDIPWDVLREQAAPTDPTPAELEPAPADGRG